jgi:mRNA-degrading endonuclease RelE of RelBE toxin-antitoxin system
VELRFKGIPYRLLYQIFRREHIVRLIALDERKSDRVYRRAANLLGGSLAADVEIT